MMLHDATVVLDRLSRGGWNPEPVAKDTWHARCPVHGGPYLALVVHKGHDGVATLRCRYVGHDGQTCSEAEVWEAIGLRPPPEAAVRSKIQNPKSQDDTPPETPAGKSQISNLKSQNGSTAEAAAGESEIPNSKSENGSPRGEATLDIPKLKSENAPSPELAGTCNVSHAGNGEAAEAVVAEATRCERPGVTDRRERLRRGGRGKTRRIARHPDAPGATPYDGIEHDVRLLRGLDHRTFARVPVDGRYETYEIRSPAFKHWLNRKCREVRRCIPSSYRINALVRAFEADAAALGSTEPVWLRVADGTRSAEEPVYYFDLGDPTWRSVEIRAGGCRIVDGVPVVFWRPKGYGPLPEPQWDGSIELLRKYTNVVDADFPLLIAWLTAALRPAGPYAILVVGGEQGSAKSTLARVVRRLISPGAAPLRGLPRTEEVFMIQARNNWVLVYDNVRAISRAMSDVCCRTATGGGHSTRTLHSTDDETIFDAERPMIFTGIDDIIASSDLLDRCVVLYLPAILDGQRRPEEEFWAEFEADCPRLLGALLGAVARGLTMLPTTVLPALPRMADFARWGEAVNRGLGAEPGVFLRRYNENRRAASESALGDCPVAEAIQQMALAELYDVPCEATAGGLLRTLVHYTSPRVVRTAQWPKTPRSLSVTLRRMAPQLRMTGIDLKFGRRGKDRIITMLRIEA
jgi:hypothetical protein